MEAETKNIQELKDDITKKQQRLGEIRQQLVSKIDELEQTKSSIEQLLKQKQEFEEEKQLKRQDLAQYEQMREEFRIEIQQRTNQVSAMNIKLNELTDHEEKLFDDIKQLENKLDKKTHEVEQNQNQLDDITGYITRLHDKKKEAESEIYNSKTQLRTINDQLQLNYNLLNDYAENYEHIKSSLLNNNDKFQTNMQQKSEIERKIQCYEKIKADIKIHYCELNEQVEQQTAELYEKQLKREQEISDLILNDKSIQTKTVRRN